MAGVGLLNRVGGQDPHRGDGEAVEVIVLAGWRKIRSGERLDAVRLSHRFTII